MVASAAATGHYLVDVLLLFEVLVHVLLAHLVVTARRLHQDLVRQVRADGHAHAVLTLRLALYLRALHRRVGRLLVDWRDTARLGRATARVTMRRARCGTLASIQVGIDLFASAVHG